MLYQILAYVCLGLAALLFLAAGLLLLIAPDWIGRRASLQNLSPRARTFVRTVKGGACIVLALFWVLCLLQPHWFLIGLASAGYAVTAAAAARFVGLWTERRRDRPRVALFVFELVLGIATVSLSMC